MLVMDCSFLYERFIDFNFVSPYQQAEMCDISDRLPNTWFWEEFAFSCCESMMPELHFFYKLQVTVRASMLCRNRHTKQVAKQGLRASEV